MQTPTTFIYRKHPKGYPQQHDLAECGLFCVKSIIESFYPDECHKPIHYAYGRIHRMLHFSRPKKLVRILQHHGIDAQEGHLKDKRTEVQINFLKKHIETGPVIVLVSHAYSKENRFNIVKALWAQHFVTLRGFDDKKRVFYCYDSHTNLKENDLPVGNMEMNYEDLVSYRKRAGCGLFKKRYIAVKGEAK